VSTVMKVFAALVGAVIALTFMTGGKFSLGTSPSGPSLSVGYGGPSSS
jgi:hypothetical protein